MELGAGLRPGPRRGAAPHLRECVEHAALVARAGPCPPDRLREAVPAVGDGDLGLGDARHQRRTRVRVLGAAQVPVEHALAVKRYQRDGLPPQVYAVDADDPPRGLGLRRHGPYLPEACRLPPEGPPAARHIGLPPPGEQPAEEGLEQLGRAVHPVHRSRAAGRAPPPRPARARHAVPLHPRPAQGACVSLHRNPASATSFSGRFSMV